MMNTTYPELMADWCAYRAYVLDSLLRSQYIPQLVKRCKKLYINRLRYSSQSPLRRE